MLIALCGCSWLTDQFIDLTFAMAFSKCALQRWDETKREFVVEPGPLDFMVGASLADIRLKEALQLSN
jgi:hypothetical protein